jgi:hypothetical protein
VPAACVTTMVWQCQIWRWVVTSQPLSQIMVSKYGLWCHVMRVLRMNHAALGNTNDPCGHLACDGYASGLSTPTVSKSPAGTVISNARKSAEMAISLWIWPPPIETNVPAVTLVIAPPGNPRSTQPSIT